MVPPDLDGVRRLALCPADQQMLPFWLDLSIHVAPAVFLWIDHLVLSPNLSKATRPYTLIAFATATCASRQMASADSADCVWLEYCTKRNGRAVYPFLDPSVLSRPQRGAVYVGSLGLAIALFETSRAIHQAVHGRPARAKTA